MKKQINFVILEFNNFGSVLNDFLSFKFLSANYQINLYIDDKIDSDNIKKLNFVTKIKEYECKGRKSIFKKIKLYCNIMKDLKNKQNEAYTFVLSANYIALLISIIWIRYNNFFLFVHFFPTIRTRLYKIIFRLIYNRVNSFIFLAEDVKNDVETKIQRKIERFSIINVRDLDIIVYNNSLKQKATSEKIKIGFIGRYDNYKSLQDLLLAIDSMYYHNCEFLIKGKDIHKFFENTNFVNKYHNNVIIENKDLSIDEYYYNLKQINYFFLNYKDNYGIRWSASLLDAIQYGCFLISKKDAPLSCFIEKYGIGFSYNTVKELIYFISNLSIKKLHFVNLDTKFLGMYSSINREKILYDIIINEERKCLI